MFILNASTTETKNNDTKSTETKGTETKGTEAKVDPKAGDKTTTGGSNHEETIKKLQADIAAERKKAADEVARAYNLGWQEAEEAKTTTAKTEPTKTTEDDDPFQIEEKVMKAMNKLRAVDDTTDLLAKAKKWAVDNVDFFNKQVPADQLSEFAVNQAYFNYKSNPKVPFINHLKQQLGLVGQQKLDGNDNKPPKTDSKVSESESDYGGETGSHATAGDALVDAERQLSELKAKATAGGVPSDALLNQIAVKSFEVNRLRVEAKKKK